MVINLINTLKFILNHPLNRNRKAKSLLTFLKWQISSRITWLPAIINYGEKSKLIIKKGMTGATQNYYCGLHEFNDMGFLLHFLRDQDLFIDVGANVGSYTILAASEVGADTISFEPIPETFEVLNRNIRLNDIKGKVKTYCAGLGAKEEVLKFTNSQDTLNHVAIDNNKETTEVPIKRLDKMVEIKHPTLAKIDVEGFESEVLKGMNLALENSNLKAMIIELNGVSKRYGKRDDETHKKLLSYGFNPYKYNPLLRELKRIKTYGSHNTIYIKDYDFVYQRISTSQKIRINNISF